MPSSRGSSSPDTFGNRRSWGRAHLIRLLGRARRALIRTPEAEMKRLAIWALLRITRRRNVRTAFVAILLSSVTTGVFIDAARQYYTSQMIGLTALTDNKQYREAISGYRTLQAQPATPGWLKAACEYEIA